MRVEIKRLHSHDLPLPRYMTPDASGVDLYAAIPGTIVIPPGNHFLIPTGIAIEIPHRHIAGLIFPRSGLATNHGIALANAVGLIDSDYKGEIIVAVINQSEREYIVKPGERIAQLVFIPVYQVTFKEVAELGDSFRGEGGFGSTGRF